MSASVPRVALVTAGAAGLGKGVVRALAAAGYRVAFTYRASGTPPDGTLAALGPLAERALAIEADFVRAGAARETVERVESRLGALDVFVHAVGPMIYRRLERSTLAEYEMLLQTNLSSAVEATLAVLPGMRARRFGRLVFFGMNESHATLPARGLSFYAAAKAGLVAFARSVSLEEARHGITLNVIEPGDIPDKEIDREGALRIAGNNPTGHAGSWQDVADAVLFLVRDDAAFINGVTMAVNGGLMEPRR